MIDELVKIETAKLAKEKGFDEMCTDYYNHEGKCDTYGYDGEKERNSGLIKIGNSHPGNTHWLTFQMAPTQSLLQRWLREVHNIHIDIISYTKKDDITFCYDYQIIWPDINLEDITKDEEDKYYDTYEIALEEGLLDALTLLP